MKILISTQMMIHEQKRFTQELCKFGYEVDFYMTDQYMSEEQCLSLSAKYDGWIAGDDQITPRVIDHLCPKLKVISKWGTGLDSISLEYAKSKGLSVTNTPGAFQAAVSELAVSMLLVLSRGVIKTHLAVKSGGWPKDRYKSLMSYTVGIVGMGAIGQGVANRILPFGSRIIYNDPNITNETFERLDLEELLSQSDAIIITCNLTKNTHHLFNESTFKLCKKAPLIVNVSRGPVVDEIALIKALELNIISGAGLDVFESEPLLKDSPLKNYDNVVLGSHNANNTFEAVEFVHQNTIANLNSILL